MTIVLGTSQNHQLIFVLLSLTSSLPLSLYIRITPRLPAMPSRLITVAQETCLPDEVNVGMPPKLPKSTMSEHPSEWSHIARRALRSDLLHSLLDISVIYPQPSDNDYKN
ncbi:hypothetical protein PENCOP_c009G02185 [Penicillium coprophilum]|uniref:Uncharacterized protein n=1 Tax=Penicillium coprophilum TaxID=36646 RepID=A0A1V6UHY8_9EURO|nr:hypothetical protein PENCOP_c009G02185 [Penicillium coprophilum]